MTELHLSRESLTAWVDRGEGDRAVIVGHLATCDECRHLAAELERGHSLASAETPPFASADFVAAGYAARGSHVVVRPAVWRRASSMAPLAAAIAAAVLLAVWIAPRRALAPSITETGEVVRGAKIQTLAPTGSSTLPIEFRWSSPIDVQQFRLEVSEPGGPIIYSKTVTAERAVSDEQLERILKPGSAYLWQVSGVSATGRVVTYSQPQPFSVAAR